MTLATAKRTHNEALADLTASVWDWLLENALERFLIEETGPVDVEVLSDWTEDAIRANVDRELGDVLLVACRLANWDVVAGWLAEELAERA